MEQQEAAVRLLSEGGNVFKDKDGNPLTQRIKQTDVKPTLAWLEQLVPGLDLQNNTLGSTGIKATSGDIDLAIDSKLVTKDQMVAQLTQWAQSHGFDPRDWIRKTGTAVHFKTPITGRPDQGYVQTDFMFLQNVPWSKFVLGAMPADSQYKGVDRNVLMNSIAKSMGYKLNQIAGIADRATNEIISDDPDTVAKMLLNKKATRDDLRSVEAILAALAKDPQRDAKLADFKEHMAREGRPFEALEENVNLENEVSFMARLRDRIVNQGMVPIMEGVRIEHPEDMVFDMGSQGIARAIAGLEATAKNPSSTTVKWDGKPAIIFGRKPTGEFVLTDKAGFLSKGYDGLATSPEMIEKIMNARGGERGELIALYKKIFPLLRAAVPQSYRGYIQGDLLFINQPPVVNGAYEFTPNTVKYRVPVDSDLGRKMAGSNVGVVIHTSIDQPGGTATPIRAADLTPVQGLLILDPSLKEPRDLKLNPKVLRDLKNLSSKYGREIDQLFNPQELRSRKISNFPQLIKTYINSRVRSGSYDNLIAGFGPWLEQKEPAKAPRIFQWAAENKRAVAAVFQAFLDISALKNEVVRQLDSQAHDVQASINDEPGHEGYVGNDMKYVDRMRFSQANFAKNNPDLA